MKTQELMNSRPYLQPITEIIQIDEPCLLAGSLDSIEIGYGEVDAGESLAPSWEMDDMP